MCARLLPLAFAALLVLAGTTSVTAQTDSDCFCTEEYAPVCAGGTTYSNACKAGCDGKTVDYIGKCANPSGCAAVLCPAGGSPVCGADGVTYVNECQATCTEVTIVRKGKCSNKQTKDTEALPLAGKDGKGTGCPCPKILKWVCGKDGVSYSNDCLAKCNGTTVAYEGRCADPAGCATVRCITEYDPVCGNDGKTYQNECFAACTGVTYRPGKCSKKRSCTCAKILAPVCGKDGKTYSNACMAKCEGVKVAYEGNCANPEGCFTARCADIDEPVCGNNGVTYRNQCLAACTGVTYKPGKCRKGGRKLHADAVAV